MREKLSLRDQARIPAMLRIVNVADDHGIETGNLYDLLIQACSVPFDAGAIRELGLTVAAKLKGETMHEGEGLEAVVKREFEGLIENEGSRLV